VESAERLANSLMFERVVDSFAVSAEFTIAEVTAPESFIGKQVVELSLRERFEISLIMIRRMERRKSLMGFGKKEVETVIGVPRNDTVINRGDVLVVFGTKKHIEQMTRE
jgi:trk system potassium uptake protein TrkA